MDAHWDDMRIFLAVARAESISGAGRALRVDAATVGRRIGRLESGLQAALFAKSPQGYALTDAGQRLLLHAERAEQALMLAGEEVSGQAHQLRGQVRIGAPDGSANFLLPQVCARIGAEHPGLELQIVAMARVFNLSKREADMAVTLSRPGTGRLNVQKITDYRLHLAASRSYLKANPPVRSRADLKRHRIVGYIPDMIFDKEIDYLSEIGAERVDTASNSFSVQLNLMRQGAGIGMVHDFAMDFAPELRLVLPKKIGLKRTFYLIRHVDDTEVERLNRIAELVTSGVSQEVARLEALLDRSWQSGDAEDTKL